MSPDPNALAGADDFDDLFNAGQDATAQPGVDDLGFEHLVAADEAPVSPDASPQVEEPAEAPEPAAPGSDAVSPAPTPSAPADRDPQPQGLAGDDVMAMFQRLEAQIAALASGVVRISDRQTEIENRNEQALALPRAASAEEPEAPAVEPAEAKEAAELADAAAEAVARAQEAEEASSPASASQAEQDARSEEAAQQARAHEASERLRIARELAAQRRADEEAAQAAQAAPPAEAPYPSLPGEDDEFDDLFKRLDGVVETGQAALPAAPAADDPFAGLHPSSPEPQPTDASPAADVPWDEPPAGSGEVAEPWADLPPAPAPAAPEAPATEFWEEHDPPLDPGADAESWDEAALFPEPAAETPAPAAEPWDEAPAPAPAAPAAEPWDEGPAPAPAALPAEPWDEAPVPAPAAPAAEPWDEAPAPAPTAPAAEPWDDEEIVDRTPALVTPAAAPVSADDYRAAWDEEPEGAEEDFSHMVPATIGTPVTLDALPVDLIWAIGELNTAAEESQRQVLAMDSMRRQAREADGRRGKRGGGVKPTKLPFASLREGDPLIMAVYSPKGGVGKSTTSVNIGAFIAESGRRMAARAKDGQEPPRVCVIDGDIGNGNLAIRVADRTEPNLLELQQWMDDHNGQAPEEYDSPDERVATIRDFMLWAPELPNLNILAAPDNAESYYDFKVEDYENLLTVLGRHFDVIVIDCGTEIVMDSTRTWLRHAHQVFMLTLPERAALHSAGKAARLIARPSDSRDILVTPDKLNIVMMRSDADLGLNPEFGMQETFPWADGQNTFYFRDFDIEAGQANNRGSFLVLENQDYSEQVGALVQIAFRNYQSARRTAARG